VKDHCSPLPCLHSVYSYYKSTLSVSEFGSRMAGGSLFQTRGPATANALWPDVVVRGMSSIMLAADREPGRPRPAKRKSSARLPARPRWQDWTVVQTVLTATFKFLWKYRQISTPPPTQNRYPWTDWQKIQHRRSIQQNKRLRFIGLITEVNWTFNHWTKIGLITY